MVNKMYINIQDVINDMGYGNIVGNPVQLTGGLMHSMYGITTEKSKYAVKELNKSIMQREGVLSNFINSEIIAERLSKIVPAVTAIKINNEAIIKVSDSYYMIFPWLDGQSIFSDKITIEHCSQIGEVLGKIHSANIKIDILEYQNEDELFYPWEQYLIQAKEVELSWTSLLKDNLHKLYEWSRLSNKSNLELHKLQVISHRDLDPKNVMWKDNEPYIIDWEAAGYVNPYKELIEVINYWASNEVGEIEEEKFIAILNGYKNNYCINNVNWRTVIDSGFSGMLGWLNYNFRRSLSLEGESEIELGTEQVLLTLDELNRFEEKTKIILRLVERYDEVNKINR